MFVRAGISLVFVIESNQGGSGGASIPFSGGSHVWQSNAGNRLIPEFDGGPNLGGFADRFQTLETAAGPATPPAGLRLRQISLPQPVPRVLFGEFGVSGLPIRPLGFSKCSPSLVRGQQVSKCHQDQQRSRHQTGPSQDRQAHFHKAKPLTRLASS